MALDRIKKRIPGFEWICVGRSEIDKYAIQAANAIYPENVDKNYGDISKINWTEVPDFDLFTYSFPCTDISNAGLQKGLAEGSGTRSGLLWECAKAIEAKRPKYLLMENVKALVSKKFTPDFLKWIKLLEDYGYSNYYKVVNATEFNVPQNRERVFCVSILGDHKPFYFPDPVPLETRLKDVLEPEVDDKYVLSDKSIEGFLKHNGDDETDSDTNESNA